MDEQVDQLIQLLKDHGLRITPQRIDILKTIISMDGHPTVEEIHQQLELISLGTIYNNVKLFVEMGILTELPYGNGISMYEMHKPNHYHVICDSCGKIADFNYPDLKEVEDVASKLTNFDIHLHHLEIYGLCTSCQESDIKPD
ncbi:Fur family transcriptional regulator [Bacillus sp. T33-2]|uniref:Fur family transcriptional regulator n=1 Tax=Bacillus sp. T33-2 TaxID=2054168 RepID=UPI0026D73A17